VKVFISWAGPRSKDVARLLYDWLPPVINEVEPWMSDADIEPGGDWNDDIKKQLNSADFGIICVTPENVHREWLLFEAGALSRQVNDSPARVAPFLVGFNAKTELRYPLARFQAVEPTREDLRKLLTSLNSQCAKPLAAAVLDSGLDAHWPRFEERLAPIRDAVPPDHTQERTERDLLQEILGVVRSLEQREAEGVARELWRDAISSRGTGGGNSGRLSRLEGFAVDDIERRTEMLRNMIRTVARDKGLSVTGVTVAGNSVSVTVKDLVNGETTFDQRSRSMKEILLGSYPDVSVVIYQDGLDL
jgi:hypothetical protein